MTLPEFTYTVYAIWPDGDCVTVETRAQADHDTARDAAFDVATTQMFTWACDVIVHRTEHDAQGRPLSIRDVTAEMLAERGVIQPSNAEPIRDVVGDRADAAFEMWGSL